MDEVDAQMSTWKPDSELMRLNGTPAGEWVSVPARLLDVLRLGLAIGRASGGAFDIGMGDAVIAWGFGAAQANPNRIRSAIKARRVPAHDALEIDGTRVRKRVPITLDLNGIAKGYGVDRLAGILGCAGIRDGLVGIAGEMRAMGLHSPQTPLSAPPTPANTALKPMRTRSGQPNLEVLKNRKAGADYGQVYLN